MNIVGYSFTNVLVSRMQVTLPKEHGSLFMNIHQQSYEGLMFVAVSSLCPRYGTVMVQCRHIETDPEAEQSGCYMNSPCMGVLN